MVVCLLFKLKEMAATFIGKTVNMPGHTWIQLDTAGGYLSLCCLYPSVFAYFITFYFCFYRSQAEVRAELT